MGEVVHYTKEWVLTACGLSYIKIRRASPLAWFVLEQPNGCKRCQAALSKKP